MKKQIVKVSVFVLIAGLIAVLDQWTKSIAVMYLKDAADVVLIPDVLVLRYVENTGMAFGLLEGARIFFFAATLIVVALIVFMVIRLPFKKRFLPLFLMLSGVTGGAVGNFIDRTFQGYVVDFIYVSAIRFPVFNTADIFVTVNAILLVIFLLFYYKDEELKALLPFGRKKPKEP
ncbi:MAG: signal peptidase II [Lachnospiraceae bacterium]|nr:signal peptidase II [Lachnospiraceae bacterium]